MSRGSSTHRWQSGPDLAQEKVLLTVRSSPHSVWLELVQPIWFYMWGLLPGIVFMGLSVLTWFPRFVSWVRGDIVVLLFIQVLAGVISQLGISLPFGAYALHRRSSMSLLSLLLQLLGISTVFIPVAHLQENTWLKMFGFVSLLATVGVLSFVVVETFVRCSRQSYSLTTDHLLISGWGMFGRSRKKVPTCRIKRVVTRQSKWQHPFGIGDVIVTVESRRRRRAIFMFDLVNYCEFGQAIQQAVKEGRFERRNPPAP
jgi:membrane protein YdbS with pleckstrin-like domain